MTPSLGKMQQRILTLTQLDSALYSSTFLAHRSQLGQFCHLCFSSDHTSRDCALQSYQSEERRGKSPARSGGATTSRCGGSGIPVCITWNKGSCMKGNVCRYLHTCAVCPENHQACNCVEASLSSIFKHFALRTSSSKSTEAMMTIQGYASLLLKCSD